MIGSRVVVCEALESVGASVGAALKVVRIYWRKLFIPISCRLVLSGKIINSAGMLSLDKNSRGPYSSPHSLTPLSRTRF